MQPIPGWIDYPAVSSGDVPTNIFLIGIISLLIMLIPTLIFLLFDSLPSLSSKQRLMEKVVVEMDTEGSEEEEDPGKLVTAGNDEDIDY
jgi:hypothetical protein